MRDLLRGYISAYHGLSAPAWYGLVLCLIESTLIGVYYFLPLYFINELHVAITTAGLMIAFYGLGTILGGFLGGRLSDRFPPAWVALLSLVVQAVVFFCLWQVQQLFVLNAILFVMGMASYVFMTANHLWILNQCQTQSARLQAISLVSVASNLGLSISAILVGIFAKNGFCRLFEMSFVAMLFAVAYGAWLVCDVATQRETHTTLIPTPAKNSPSIATYPQSIVKLVLFFVFIVGAVIAQSSTTYSTYIKDTFPDFGMQGVSFLFLLNSSMVVLLQAPLTTLMAERDKLSLIGWGAFLVAVSMITLPLAPAFGVVAVGMILHTLGEIIFFAPAQFVCYESAPAAARGRSIGKYRTVYACSRVGAPALGGYIYQQFSGDILWYGCAVLGVLALLLCYYVKQQTALFTYTTDVKLSTS